MTDRKPPNVSFPDFVEAQIREAEQRGAFKNLPGAGKPIPGLDRPTGDMDWIVGKLRRENVDIAAVLPPALALAKEVEALPERVRREHSEARVRSVVEDLNQRIRQAQLRPQVGPPMRVRPVDADQVVTEWLAARAAASATSAAVAGQPSPPPAPVTRSHRELWWRRLFTGKVLTRDRSRRTGAAGG